MLVSYWRGDGGAMDEIVDAAGRKRELRMRRSCCAAAEQDGVEVEMIVENQSGDGVRVNVSANVRRTAAILEDEEKLWALSERLVGEKFEY